MNNIYFQVAQYIGEMCRYILATPDNSADRNHNIKTIFGNGLRPQIWPQFVKRFNIPNVAEFYGATEGNANIGKSIPRKIHFRIFFNILIFSSKCKQCGRSHWICFKNYSIILSNFDNSS